MRWYYEWFDPDQVPIARGPGAANDHFVNALLRDQARAGRVSGIPRTSWTRRVGDACSQCRCAWERVLWCRGVCFGLTTNQSSTFFSLRFQIGWPYFWPYICIDLINNWKQCDAIETWLYRACLWNIHCERLVAWTDCVLSDRWNLGTTFRWWKSLVIRSWYHHAD